MATGKDKRVIYEKIRDYVKTLEKNKVPVWRLYLYGSYAKNTFHSDSDIDLAVFWDRDDIDGLDEDIQLRMLTPIIPEYIICRKLPAGRLLHYPTSKSLLWRS